MHPSAGDREPPDLTDALTKAMVGSDRFGHRQHIHLAWIAVGADPDNSAETVCTWLRAIADHHGTPERFHRTMTVAWTSLVRHHVDHDLGTGSFDSFAARYPGLLNSNLLNRHWSNEMLFSHQARTEWVEPDLCPLPAGL